MKKERGKLPDRGNRYAVLMTLFRGKHRGRVVPPEEIAEAMKQEHSDYRGTVSKEQVWVEVCRLNKVLNEFDYDIKLQNGIGYKIISPEDTVEN